MAFVAKDWRDFPDISTPITAPALEDIEVRLAAYADSLLSGVFAPRGGLLMSMGTSRSAGGGGPWDTSDRFPSKLAGLLGMAEVMNAHSGAVWAWDDNGGSGGGWTSQMHHVIAPKLAINQNFRYPSQYSVVTLADYINDAPNVNGGAAGTTRTNTRATNIGKHTLRTYISLACMSRMLEPTMIAAGELTYGGTASTQVATTYDAARPRAYRGAQAGPAGYRSMPNGAWVEMPLPNDYAGQGVCLLFAGDPAITTGSVALTGTGVAGGPLDLTAANMADPNRRNPLLLRIPPGAMAAGSKTIRATVTTSAGNARFCRAWVESLSPPIVLAYNTAQLNPAGGSVFWPGIITEADYDYWNASIIAPVVAEYGSHVRLVDIDSLIGGTNPASSSLDPYLTDTMHGSELGCSEYALAGLCAVLGESVPPLSNDTHPLRVRARKARANVQDMKFRGSISADLAVTNLTLTPIVIDQELEDNSGMHGGLSDVTARDHVMALSRGEHRATLGLTWANNAVGVRTIGLRRFSFTAPLTGTMTASGTTVTGTGTAFTTELAAGDLIMFETTIAGVSPADRSIRQVQSIASATSLVLTATLTVTATRGAKGVLYHPASQTTSAEGSSTFGPIEQVISYDFDMEVGDIIQPFAYQTSGGSVNVIAAKTVFEMTKRGSA